MSTMTKWQVLSLDLGPSHIPRRKPMCFVSFQEYTVGENGDCLHFLHPNLYYYYCVGCGSFLHFSIGTDAVLFD